MRRQIEDGGVTDSSNPNAPKQIESTLIIAFRCEFSALDRLAEDTLLGGHTYRLEARLRDGAVRGICRTDGEEKLFRAGHRFMYQLQEVVAQHELARHNGHSIRAEGLPEDCGALLDVCYASGERIYAADNQDCFLALEAMEELEALFRAEIKDFKEELT